MLVNKPLMVVTYIIINKAILKRSVNNILDDSENEVPRIKGSFL